MTVKRPQLLTLRACAALVCALAGLPALATEASLSAALPPNAALPPSAALPPGVLQALQAAQVPASAVSMLVLPLDGGPARLSHEANTVRTVASVMKLFTTGVALQTLGPAFTWHTDVALGGRLLPNGTLQGPLLLRGEGDPSLTIEKVAQMMTRWRAAGLRDIRGDILLDRSAFMLPENNPAALDGFPLKTHNAGPDALLIAHQAVTLRLRPDVSRPGWAQISLEPEMGGVRLNAQIPLDDKAPCSDWRESLALQVQADAKQPSTWVMTLTGRYPTACAERDWPVHWPGGLQQDHSERVLSMAWRRVGGVLQGQVKAGTWPVPMQAWTTWESPPLASVVRDINKYSNNVMARQLFLTLGRDGGVATLEAARHRVGHHVVQATSDAKGASPCLGDALVLDNGSGLSRAERSTAACVGRWLQVLWASPVMPELLASLPVAGVDGTARKLRSVAGQAHLKTGSMDSAVALAGVALSDSGRRYVVVGVINDPKAEAARSALEALVQWTVQER